MPLPLPLLQPLQPLPLPLPLPFELIISRFLWAGCAGTHTTIQRVYNHFLADGGYTVVECFQWKFVNLF